MGGRLRARPRTPAGATPRLLRGEGERRRPLRRPAGDDHARKAEAAAAGGGGVARAPSGLHRARGSFRGDRAQPAASPPGPFGTLISAKGTIPERASFVRTVSTETRTRRPGRNLAGETFD